MDKLRNAFFVGLIFVACKYEDNAAKKEAEVLRTQIEALKTENEHLKAELAAAQARTTSGPSSPSRQTPSPGQPPGRQFINEFEQLKEGQQRVWRVPPGRYRVRATASNAGVKLKWVGAACASSKGEVKVYDDVCDVSSESQLVIENPSGLTGRGPTETVSVNVTTM